MRREVCVAHKAPTFYHVVIDLAAVPLLQHHLQEGHPTQGVPGCGAHDDRVDRASLDSDTQQQRERGSDYMEKKDDRQLDPTIQTI
jgi:hypothetical protein